MMSFARPDPEALLTTGALDVCADRPTPNRNAARASTNSRRPRPTLTMPTSAKGSLRDGFTLHVACACSGRFRTLVRAERRSSLFNWQADQPATRGADL